jgi:Protein of unknown function (DUF2889)
MPADDTNLALLRNPDFGRGATRRRIRLSNAAGRCDARLVDTFHEMTCEVEHDGRQVAAIRGASLRIPNSNCPGAVAVLQELVGLELATPARGIYAGGRARRHCTHLLDLAVLAMAQAARGDGERVYEVVVPDETDVPVTLEIRRNGEILFCWQAHRGRILAPDDLAGRPLGPGFMAWATDFFAADELEAATVLSRTYFIARGRSFDLNAWAGEPVRRNPDQRDTCYGYATARGEEGVFLAGTLRDFSAGIPLDD